MAERRMFAKTIIDSDAFLDMPLSTQALYFHLSMRADDDGFVNNPKKIQRVIGASDDDLRVLIAKKFLIPFESGIVVIKHWRIHNYIQNDRYKSTVYTEEKKLLQIKANNAYTLDGYTMDTECIQDVSNMDTERIQDVSKADTQVSIGKVSIDKDREESIPASAGTRAQKHKYGSYGHVMLTDEEYSKLTSDFGDLADPSITFLDEYIEMKGYKCKSHYLAIRKWVVDAVKERQRKTQKPRQESQHHFENERKVDYEALFGGGIIGNG